MKPYKPDSLIQQLARDYERFMQKHGLVMASLRAIEGQLKALGFEVKVEDGRMVFKAIEKKEEKPHED